MEAFSSPYSRLFMNKNNKPKKPKWWEILIILLLLSYIIGQLIRSLT